MAVSINKKQIRHALKNTTLAYFVDKKNTVQGLITDEMTLLENAFDLTERIKLITKLDEPLFEIETKKEEPRIKNKENSARTEPILYFHKLKDTELTSLGWAIYEGIGTGETQLNQNFHLHEKNPYLDCFYTQIKNFTEQNTENNSQRPTLKEITSLYSFKKLQESHKNVDPEQSPYHIIVDVLNQFIESLKQALNHADFKLTARNYYRAPQQNFINTVKYIDRLIEQNPLLWSTRMVLGLNKQDNWPDVRQPPQSTTYEEVRRYRESLLKYLRGNETFSKNWIGYIWKLEYSLFSGFNYHFVMFFNISSENPALTEMVGKTWNEHSTERKGLYAAYPRDEEEPSGTDTERNNEAYKADLHNLAAQLTKTDDYIRMKRESGRFFGKGQLPFIKGKQALSRDASIQVQIDAEIRIRKLERANRKLRKELEQLRNEKTE